jgi:hypothetical protein
LCAVWPWKGKKERMKAAGGVNLSDRRDS